MLVYSVYLLLEELFMDKHFTLFPMKDPDTLDHVFLISNRSDDVIGTVNIRSYEKDLIPDVQGLFCGLSSVEVQDILTNFVAMAEKTAEYDKCGQSYYNAKRILKNKDFS
jgi:hypothetical protein